ncbi:MAG: hypothetical protein FJ340_02005 [Sphingomonadales bacterium]|nr:hypothetical protein [Sphingomonadales bacterium]
MSEAIKLLQASGATLEQKSGAFLMPLSSQLSDAIELDSIRMTRDAGKVAEEVISHLSAIVGSNVKITLEISAEISEGVPDQIVRIVNENCRSLNFKSQGFESD